MNSKISRWREDRAFWTKGLFSVASVSKYSCNVRGLCRYLNKKKVAPNFRTCLNSSDRTARLPLTQRNWETYPFTNQCAAHLAAGWSSDPGHRLLLLSEHKSNCRQTSCSVKKKASHLKSLLAVLPDWAGLRPIGLLLKVLVWKKLLWAGC